MDNNQKVVPIVVSFLRSFTAIFTLVILTNLFMGLFISDYYPNTQEISSLFALGKIGLTYNTILQLAGFSFISATFSILLFSEYFFLNIRFFLRYMLLLLSTMFNAIVFVIIFDWFPLNNISSWLGLILSMSLLYFLFSSITLIIFKKKDKKYNKLLDDYKLRNNPNYHNR